MGNTSYSFDSRSVRAESMGYHKKSASEIFTQMKESKIHDSMDPRKIRLREARDSELHPLSFPVIFGMDVTGSMGRVPHMLIMDGLPKMISDIMQKGISDPALLFVALGDSQNPDRAPFQVAQFESGDAELDMWLTRTWPEGKGGGNAGESYLWAWYFAANHVVTDHWEKRKSKGVLITFGDEPCLQTLTRHELKEFMDIDSQQDYKAIDLLRAAQEKWHVYHLNLNEHRPPHKWWFDVLGENLIQIGDYTTIPQVVAQLCERHKPTGVSPTPEPTKKDDVQEGETSKPPVIL